MQGFFALLSAALVLTVILYGSQPDPPSMVVQLARGGIADWQQDNKCEIKNLEQLRKSAIVYTWVNGTERCYNTRRQRAGLPPGGSSRDKEMGELKYSIRSLMKFAPWLEGPIYIVTPGQIPDWLDPSNSRIKVIDQDDLLPKDKATLPTFDTNVIEQYLHKIPGLTDTFIHMNDDYLFIKPITPHRFFTCDGGLRFLTEINHIRHVKNTKSNAWLASVRNTVELADKTYGGEHVYNFLKHAPFVYSRLAFEKIHERFREPLDATLSHQVRHHEDLNMPLLHHIYMNEEGSKLLSIPIEFNPIAECDDWLLVRVTDNERDRLNTQFQAALESRGPEVLLALNDEYSEPETAELVGKFYAKLLPNSEFYELPEGQHLSLVSNYHGPNCAYDRSVIPLPSGTSYSYLRQRFTDNIPSMHHNSQYETYFVNHPDMGAFSFVATFAYVLGLGLAVVCSVFLFRLTSQDLLVSSHGTKDT
ncbi:hypothetical protein Poli38472_003964 [Pythium oligandrum]|uniref:Exopolysaccharide phosphotransferase n=1 Tax=Pythium oligandrum TaxID=41045 RepID=A0A8K1CN78_PYTOL|nr:hypothetical protein Poli38472_003964 [Pythium oligandrum]|eukprot:TMW66199.1 hypothetical protein Poli38472_003964 [Pythium oligandrum]